MTRFKLFCYLCCMAIAIPAGLWATDPCNHTAPTINDCGNFQNCPMDPGYCVAATRIEQQVAQWLCGGGDCQMRCGDSTADPPLEVQCTLFWECVVKNVGGMMTCQKGDPIMEGAEQAGNKKIKKVLVSCINQCDP